MCGHHVKWKDQSRQRDMAVQNERKSSIDSHQHDYDVAMKVLQEDKRFLEEDLAPDSPTTVRASLSTS